MTLPKMFKSMGYRTGIVGKWHLGLGDGRNTVRDTTETGAVPRDLGYGPGVRGNIDYNNKISPGPNEVGFEHSFIMADTQDRVHSSKKICWRYSTRYSSTSYFCRSKTREAKQWAKLCFNKMKPAPTVPVTGSA